MKQSFVIQIKFSINFAMLFFSIKKVAGEQLQTQNHHEEFIFVQIQSDTKITICI